MKGLELSEKYYRTFGKPMIESRFPEYKDRIAAGLAGEGSECFGFDDEISRDHDFGPRFCLWLTDEDYQTIGEELQFEYLSLPDSFEGFSRNKNSFHDSGRHGVMPVSRFYTYFTGCPEGPRSLREWFRIPSHFLAAAGNGKVFDDPLGKFTDIRNNILYGMPEDVRKKQIAARAFEMAQSGQYNFPRCLRHGEKGAAYIALSRFVTAAVKIIYSLNRKHCPYYKWMFRGMADLPVLGDLSSSLTALISGTVAGERFMEQEVERISSLVSSEIVSQGLSSIENDYLEPVAVSVQNGISSPEIRSIHLSREN